MSAFSGSRVTYSNFTAVGLITHGCSSCSGSIRTSLKLFVNQVQDALQALSALLWRPLGSHSFRPTWNKVHANWGKATMAVGATAVCLGIHVAGVGWPWYLLYAFLTGSILGAAYYMDPLRSKKVQSATYSRFVVPRRAHMFLLFTFAAICPLRLRSVALCPFW